MLKRAKAVLLLLIAGRNRRCGRDGFEIKKVLVLKYDRLGDMIATTPLLASIKANFPNIQLDVLASAYNRVVIDNNPSVDAIYENHKSNFISDLPVLLRLRSNKYDACLELDHSVIWHAIFRLKIIRPRKIFSVHKDGRYGILGSQLHFYSCMRPRHDGHISLMWLDLMNCFSEKSFDLNREYRLYPTHDEVNEAVPLIPESEDKKVLINYRGSFEEKSLKMVSVREIVNGLKRRVSQLRFYFLVMENERESLMSQAKRLGLDGLNFISHHNFMVIAAAIRRIDLLITPDTSLVHIASAWQTPVVSIHEKNLISYKLWAPLSMKSHTVFSSEEYGIADFSTNEVVEYAATYLSD
jgi:ADP-heptose:LPS heptosyltransferase